MDVSLVIFIWTSAKMWLWPEKWLGEDGSLLLLISASFVSLGSYLLGSLSKPGSSCLSAGQDSIDVAVKEQTAFCCLIHHWQRPANCCCQALHCGWWSWSQRAAWGFLMGSDSYGCGTEELHPSFDLWIAWIWNECHWKVTRHTIYLFFYYYYFLPAWI